MQLQLRNFDDLVSGAAASVQGSATQLLDLTTGSTLRAVLEADASIALWMQWLILEVLRTTRAATSSASDLDTWMADYAVTRLPATSASGVVTFARFVAGAGAQIPIGTTVRTGDGTQSYTVIADTGYASLDAAGANYLFPATRTSLDVPIVATAPGTVGNVQAGTVSLIAAALPGVDTVGNAGPISGGVDAESDDALRARFVNVLSSLARSTPLAVRTAIQGVRQGLSFTMTENVAADGSARPGNFVVVVDDGTGAPSAALIADVAAAVEAVRPVGTGYQVIAPIVIYATVSITISTAAGSDHADVAAAVATAVAGGIDALSIGAILPWSRLAQFAYQASSSVTNVSNVLLNGGVFDLVPPASGVIKAAPVVVT